MVDDLTQQPTDISQDSLIPPVPETPQEPQPVETPPPQEPIIQEPVQPLPITPAPEETPTVPIEPIIPNSSETQLPEPTQIFETPLLSPIPPTEPIPIPQLRFPFNGNFPLTFSFGQQSNNEEIKKKFQEWGINGHHGLDFALPEGTEVLSVDSGKVIQSGGNGDFGISMTIQHSWGQSLYAHLQETKVSPDQEVQAGDLIGLSGQTGAAYGAHLHFGIKPNNSDQNNGYLDFIDPVQYLPPISPIPPITPISEEKPIEPPSFEPLQSPQTPEVPQEPIVEAPILTEAEVDRRAQGKLLAELEIRRQKANHTRQIKKEENLVKIEKLITEKGKINNDDVCDFLHVSQSTASSYLKTLVNQGKIRVEGKAKATTYQSIF